MKTYWDHTEQERAAMTHEQVNELQKFELMEAGIFSPKAPALQDETPPPIPTRKFYKVTYGGDGYSVERSFDSLFQSTEAAEAFIALNPAVEQSDWQISGSFYKEVGGYRIQAVDLPTEEDRISYKPRLTELKNIKEANKKLKTDYEAAVRDSEQACIRMWEDYHELVVKNNRFARIIEVWKTYVKECDGNEEIALRFLRKSISVDDFVSACEWCGESCPIQLEAAELLDANEF